MISKQHPLLRKSFPQIMLKNQTKSCWSSGNTELLSSSKRVVEKEENLLRRRLHKAIGIPLISWNRTCSRSVRAWGI